MSKSLIVIVMLAVAAPAVARQASPGAHPNTRLGALRAKKPKVVCGMTIIEAEPLVDRKMTAPRQDAKLKYTIRAIDPPLCNPSS